MARFSRVSAIQAAFGKDLRDLTPRELAVFRRAYRLARYYANHAGNVVKSRNRKRDLKIRLIKALSIEPRCQRCGYDRYVGALDFHHREPSEKSDLVMLSGPFDQMLAEARKCELICSNCHREEHEADCRFPGRPRKTHDPRILAYLRASGVLVEFPGAEKTQ